MNKKNILVVFLLVLAVALCFNNVFAFSTFEVDNVKDVGGTTDGMDTANNAVKRIWGTVSLILQVCAVAAVVFAGVRYMFASADGKADIKKQTVGLIVGAILVFGATTLINFVITITSEVTGGTSRIVNSDGSVSRSSDYDNDGVNDWAITKGNTTGLPDILVMEEMKDQKCLEKWLEKYPEDKDAFKKFLN